MEANGSHRWEQLLPAYSLGALEPAETRELETHLASCERCRERLRWLEPAVDVLPASVEQLEPPPELKQRLMAVVHEDAAAAGIEKRPWWRGPRVSFSLRPALAVAAAGLLIAGAVGYGLNAGGGETTTVPPTPTLVDAVAGQGVEASAVLEVGATGATLNVERLPRLAPNEDYQAWVQKDGEFLPSVTFELREDGTAQPYVELPANAEAVLVTREPNGGSEQPSTAPILRAKLIS